MIVINIYSDIIAVSILIITIDGRLINIIVKICKVKARRRDGLSAKYCNSAECLKFTN